MSRLQQLKNSKSDPVAVEEESWSHSLLRCCAHGEGGVCCTGGSRLRLRIRQGLKDGLPGSAADNPWYASSEEAEEAEEAQRLRDAAAALTLADGEPSWKGIRWATARSC